MTNVIWPVPPNGPNGTYVFAWDQDYGDRSPESFHNGLDFSNYPGGSTGIAVVAVASGTVIGKQTDPWKDTALGNYIWLDHGTFQSRYCHMEANSHSHLSNGSVVAQGAQVGTIGNTGTATTGPHLHLDIYVNGQRIDPQAFIRNNYGSEGSAPSNVHVRNNNGMSSLFHIQNTDGSHTWALAGDGVGTAAWLQISDVNVANGLALQHGNAVNLDWGTWQAWKAAYLSKQPVQQ